MSDLELEIKKLLINGFEMGMEVAAANDVPPEKFAEWTRHGILSIFLSSNDMEEKSRPESERLESIEQHLTNFVAAARTLYADYLKQDREIIAKNRPLSILKD